MSTLFEKLIELGEEGKNRIETPTKKIERLIEKWEKTGLLEKIEKKGERATLALLLEIQAIEAALAHEFDKSDGTFLASVVPFVLPLTRYLHQILHQREYISVLPMETPAGLVFYMEREELEKKGEVNLRVKTLPVVAQSLRIGNWPDFSHLDGLDEEAEFSAFVQNALIDKYDQGIFLSLEHAGHKYQTMRPDDMAEFLRGVRDGVRDRCGYPANYVLLSEEDAKHFEDCLDGFEKVEEKRDDRFDPSTRYHWEGMTFFSNPLHDKDKMIVFHSGGGFLEKAAHVSIRAPMTLHSLGYTLNSETFQVNPEPPSEIPLISRVSFAAPRKEAITVVEFMTEEK